MRMRKALRHEELTFLLATSGFAAGYCREIT
jgi:hypothetical protein